MEEKTKGDWLCYRKREEKEVAASLKEKRQKLQALPKVLLKGRRREQVAGPV
jgi:hypothetical protein